MKESYLIDMTFNNIVFKGRNKAYGAYALRRTYSRHIIMAAIIATALFSGALVWSLVESLASEPTPVAKAKEVVFLYPVDIMPPPPTAEKVKQAQQPQQLKKVATIGYTKPKVVADNAPVTERGMPTQQQLTQAIIAASTSEGEVETNIPPVSEPVGNTPAGTTQTVTDGIYTFVAEMPSYKNGEQGLIKYLSKNLRYPAEAIREGIEGIVVVSFVINSSGEVTEATVVKSLGYGTDEEAIRVIQNMPRWTPGQQNGKPVAVRFTMPIRFSVKR